ncbi:ACT domain-containing protein [Thioalkalivibrio sp. XN8]|uniref:ACT domain-containing protein n=1 Tax=Thioalkalivibrio sp. XN8 TaxID=2712863 RepID=UPI0013EA4036|nr:ACT domain-containing protein [Thioalkalivibrio sp. XN8]NGP52324.1 acetolactate synthase [Thioalkalivibrio sp. XN8]
MNHTLQMNLHQVEGALIRLLGLIERRGFAVTSMNAYTGEQHVEVTVDIHSAGRSVETLTRQIQKLYDVRSVACLTAAEAPAALGGSVAC